MPPPFLQLQPGRLDGLVLDMPNVDTNLVEERLATGKAQGLPAVIPVLVDGELQDFVVDPVQYPNATISSEVV